jgi:asparagine synthase (glutamine-hydrolysing)
MCGIAGIWELHHETVEEARLKQATRTLEHRGPDDEGYWIKGNLGFGHRRLSIIDPTGSPQPMTIGPMTICFNGEIFNYQSLRQDLMASGHQFTHAGDTEVIIAQFLKDGQAAAEKLNGQFAFALYDERSRELLLYRDRLGVMPLYYYFDGKRFLFASEIKAIISALGYTPEIDLESLREYFSYRSVPVPNTLFKGIQKLTPGCWLRITADGSTSTGAYWKLPTEASDESISSADAIELIETSVIEAVESRLVADVPVGAFLSGGVDSSLIVALMSKLKGGSGVETYSAGFDHPDTDELQFAKVVADQYQTSHHEVIVPPQDLQNLWPKLTWHRDGPVSEPADVAVFRLSQKARERVKVLLSGEGADELFAGYGKYRRGKKVASLDFLPVALRRLLMWPIRHHMMAAIVGAKEGVDRTRAWRAAFTPAELDQMFGVGERHNYQEIWDRSAGDQIQHMLYYDCHTWLVDNLLERGDRMAMAASMEFRPPFLDHRLVELAFRLPSRMKLRGTQTKWVAKEVARRNLPSSIVDRRKVGFQVPMNVWFKNDLQEYTRDLLMAPNSLTLTFADRKALQKMLDDHMSGRRDHQRRIWSMISLEIWHNVFYKDSAGISKQAA